MNIAIDQLPPASEISNPAIRDAVSALSAARTALRDRQRDVTEAEQTLPQSEWADAELEAKAIAAGKPAPKERANTRQHRKRIEDAKHAHRVATISEQHALEGLKEALADHGDSWLEELERHAAKLNGEWLKTVDKLAELHNERTASARIRRTINPSAPAVAVIGVTRRECRGFDYAAGGSDVAHIETGIVLSKLADLGTPAPAPEPPSQQHATPQTRSALADHADVRAEIEQRQRFQQTVKTR